MNYYAVERSTFLTHHGILGQKWGIRRYQNKDGSLTAAGRKHYKKVSDKNYTSMLKAYKVRENAKQLTAASRKLDAARDVLIKDNEEYFERARKNPKQFQEDVKKAMDLYIDEDELRELAQMELDEVIKEGKDLKDSWIANKAYHIHTATDPDYLRKYTPFIQSMTELNTLSKALAIQAYDKAGPKAMRKWSQEGSAGNPDGGSKSTRDDDIDMLAYLMKEEAKKSK